MSASDLTRVRYAGLDFDTITDEILVRLQSEYAEDYNDFATSSLGIMLVDLFGYAADALGFYIDRRSTDYFFATARTRQAITLLARGHRYKPRAATASGTDLEVRLKRRYPFAITIPQGFRFKGPNNTVWEAAEEVSWPPNAAPSDRLVVPVYEGETISETFTGSGLPGQVYQLHRVPSDKFIVSGSVKVVIDGQEIPEKDFADWTTDPQFEALYTSRPPEIRFGDGLTGYSPRDGAAIVVTYVASKGRSGRADNDTIRSTIGPLIVNATQIDIEVTNPNPSIGGDDPETPEEVRVNAPRAWKAADRAVTERDYAALAGTYADPLSGRVAAAQALIARSVETNLAFLHLVEDASESVQGISKLVDTHITPAIENAETNAEAWAVSGEALSGAQSALESALEAIGEAADEADRAKDATAIVLGSAARIDEVVRPSGSIMLALTDLTQEQEALLGNLRSFIEGLDPGTPGRDDALNEITQGLAALEEHRQTILVQLDRAKGQAASITAAAGEISAACADITAGTIAARDALEEARDGSNPDAPLTRLTKALEEGSTATDKILVNLEAMGGQEKADFMRAFARSMDAITDHVDGIVADDRQANLVVVPVLAQDADGFYAPPTRRLIDSLSRHLNERKDVAHAVSVVSGERALIPAVLKIEIGVIEGHRADVVEAAATKAVNALLKMRPFGKRLYRTDIARALAGVNGLDWSNIVIEGSIESDGSVSTHHLDDQGNLNAPAGKVITRGSVQITTRPAAERLNAGGLGAV